MSHMSKTVFKNLLRLRFARPVTASWPQSLPPPVKLADPKIIVVKVPLWAVTISIEDNSQTNNPSCLGCHSQNNQPQQKQKKAPLPALIVNKGFWHNWFFFSFSSQFAPVAMVFVSLGCNLTFLFQMFLQQTAQRRRMLLSWKWLRSLDNPDAFHMEMSECLWDSCSWWRGKCRLQCRRRCPECASAWI